MPAVELGLPIRPFLYTLDQIADLIGKPLRQLRLDDIYFDDVTPGVKPTSKMLARNVAAPGDKPDWRVAEQEFKRWLRLKRFRIYDRSQLRI